MKYNTKFHIKIFLNTFLINVFLEYLYKDSKINKNIVLKIILFFKIFYFTLEICNGPHNIPLQATDWEPHDNIYKYIVMFTTGWVHHL